LEVVSPDIPDKVVQTADARASAPARLDTGYDHCEGDPRGRAPDCISARVGYIDAVTVTVFWSLIAMDERWRFAEGTEIPS
jgi:hypothetical protein